MANVTPGYTFTGTADPITFVKLNLIAQPTVAIGNDEITSAMIAGSVTLESPTVTGGLTVSTGGLAVSAGGLTVSAGGANVTGGVTVADGLTVSTGGAAITAGGITLGVGTPINMAASTETFTGTIALTFGAAKGNTRLIPCSSNTASAISAATVPAAGYLLILRFTTDATAGNVITFSTNFKSTGTYTLSTANKYYSIVFVSDGTNLIELSRTAAAG
jgi:hypothetical protein